MELTAPRPSLTDLVRGDVEKMNMGIAGLAKDAMAKLDPAAGIKEFLAWIGRKVSAAKLIVAGIPATARRATTAVRRAARSVRSAVRQSFTARTAAKPAASDPDPEPRHRTSTSFTRTNSFTLPAVFAFAFSGGAA